MVAFREFNRTRPKGMGLLEAIRRSKDTNVVVVVLEDSAALLGLLIAFIGVGLAELTGNMAFDAIASIAIGLLLAVVAYVLAGEVKELLIGEAASPANRKAIHEAITSFEQVSAVGQVLTMHLAPKKILVTMDVEFADGLTTDELEAVIDRIETTIRERVPAVDRIFIEAERILGVDRAIVRPTKPKSSAHES
jgi:divalent metal cation (Fe/Co/Zn/Cd) transporter